MVPSDDERDDDADERLQWSAIAKAKPIAIAAVPTTVFGTHKMHYFPRLPIPSSWRGWSSVRMIFIHLNMGLHAPLYN